MNGPPIVVKVGGSTLGSHDTSLEDAARLHAGGQPVVLVHGGGEAATSWLGIHGVESTFVDGLRVTGPDAIDVVVAVFAGLVNTRIVSELLRLEAPAFGFSGLDGGLVLVQQLDERLGYVGDVVAIDRHPLDLLLAVGYLPVIAPVGYWPEGGRLMNVNADTVAGEIAAALRAAGLVFLTDVAHVRDGSGADLQAIAMEQVEPLIGRGAASGGMIPKLRAGARAAAEGVRCRIVDGREAHALRRALEGADVGTLVTA